MEAGLSLAEVAAGEVSRTAIHLVETGAARPSMRTLELIARRTRRPVEHFLAGKPEPTQAIDADRLHELEGLYEAGRQRELITSAGDLLGDAGSPWMDAYLRLLIGRSLVRVGHPEQALVELERAAGGFDATGDPWGAVEALDWIAGAQHLQEDPSALSTARRALRQCRRLRPMPFELETRILCHVAAILVSRHAWREAVEAYDAAARAAGKLRDLRRVAQVHDGLSLAYEALGARSKALLHSRKALTLRSLDRDLGVVARTENNLGLMLLRDGRHEEAREHLQRALDRCVAVGLERGRGHVLLSLCELEEAVGHTDVARWYAREALELARSLGERMTEAAAHMHLASVAAAAGDRESSDQHFITAIAQFEALDVPARVFECRSAYAQVLERRGDLAGALEQWKQAARLSAAGDDGRHARAALVE